MLCLAEVSGTIRRLTGSADLANSAVALLSRMATRTWHVDGIVGSAAASLAAKLALRGADAVYVALACELGEPLVTLDKEQIERAATVVLIREL